MNQNNQSKELTEKFYNDLVKGKNQRGILGLEKRFNVDKIINSNSIYENFTKLIKKEINENDVVLDFGCGPGAFLILASKFCKNIVGVEISSEFVKAAKKNVKFHNIKNASVELVDEEISKLPYKKFDKIILVDVIHHLDNIDFIMKKLSSFLKKNGKFVIFEPNKLNPLMYLMHLIDKNERGLLRVGSPKKYKEILSPLSSKINIKYSGLVVGPDSFIFDILTKILNNRLLYPFFGWLNPKIYVTAVKS